ncbi:MAG: hypothetical protein IGS48_12485 [Oscillatoriales cyanobacterium C42_A2020_001]|nr:hypothetical protein [Leptolyngbyaceae cyanobacterium C42_A2020_001]
MQTETERATFQPFQCGQFARLNKSTILAILTLTKVFPVADLKRDRDFPSQKYIVAIQVSVLY